MSDDHEQLDPAEALMREVGAQLRQVRLERGEELDEVAEHLRIKSTYLFGIEQGDLSRMPGRTYALGFLRSYADYLGFDGDDLIAQIKSSVADLTARTRLRIRTPLPESRLPKTPILVISVAAVAAIYAGWSYLGQSGQRAIQTVAEVPENLRNMALDALNEDRPRSAPPAAPIDGVAAPPAIAAEPSEPPAPPRPAAEEPAMTASPAPPERPDGALTVDERGLSLVRPEAGADRQVALNMPAPGAPAVDAAPPAPAAGDALADGQQPAAAPALTPTEDLARRAERLVEAPAPVADTVPAEVTIAALAPEAGVPDAGIFEGAGEIYEAENTDARVVLRARGSSWIRISSLGGDYLRTRTLQQGDVFLVPNRGDLELWTGNAGGIEVIVDGALLAPIGRDGAVVREVPLDPPSLHARFGNPAGP